MGLYAPRLPQVCDGRCVSPQVYLRRVEEEAAHPRHPPAAVPEGGPPHPGAEGGACVCVRACVYECMCILVCACVCVCVYKCVQVFVWLCVYVAVNGLFVCVWVLEYLRDCVCVRKLFVRQGMFVCVCVCMHSSCMLACVCL